FPIESMKNPSIRSRNLRLVCAFVLALFCHALTAGAQQGSIPIPEATPLPLAIPTPTPGYFPRSAPVGVAKPVLAERTGPREETMRLPLRKLIGVKDGMLLRNASNYYTLFVPQSARLKLKSCTLHLDFTNSIAL